MADQELFIIRQASSLNDVRWAVNMCIQEGWPTREKDAECYFSAGMTPHYFIGELNGEKISCIAVYIYDDTYCFVSFFIVDPEHRGKGYGLRTWKRAMEYVGEGPNLVLESVTSMEEIYKKSGLHREFMVRKYVLISSKIAKSLSEIKPPEGIRILPGCKADINKLHEYTKGILGISCKHLLASWISLDTSISFVAVNGQLEIVGSIIVVKNDKGDYMAVPFLSNCLSTAQTLLSKSVQLIVSVNPEATLLVYVPESNLFGMRMFEEQLGGILKGALIRMCTKGHLDIQISFVFGLSSLEY
jgi:GNAT superfamily N-acetyltransferase